MEIKAPKYVKNVIYYFQRRFVEYQLKPYMPDVIDEMRVLTMAHTSLTSYRFNFQQHILPIQRSVWHPISCVCFVFVLVCYTQN